MASFKTSSPHEDDPRKYVIGRVITDARLGRGLKQGHLAAWMLEKYPLSGLANAGRISELETGRKEGLPGRWSAPYIRFLAAKLAVTLPPEAEWWNETGECPPEDPATPPPPRSLFDEATEEENPDAGTA